ncbi:MAG: nicotinate (nicotinamide) nucleotide adenylyltransferase [Chthonomonas sp.]|nr:nicotinate (nicotinamide) nucleotide adenylyltransferase [Chthonomonas sp.]
MKIGILGGTFDPPHLTHLDLAETAAQKLGLDQILLVPNKRNPIKRLGPRATARDRFAMTKLMAEGRENFAVSDVELGRSGPSFAVDTLIELNQAIKAKFWWILGSDAAMHLEEWYELDKILKLARFAVGLRPPDDMAAVMRFAPEKVHGNLDFFLLNEPSPRSSTEIRNNIGIKLDESRQVLPSVWQYIQEHQLYRMNDDQ